MGSGGRVQGLVEVKAFCSPAAKRPPLASSHELPGDRPLGRTGKDRKSDFGAFEQNFGGSFEKSLKKLHFSNFGDPVRSWRGSA